jgi:multidrug transporter EmrE-like cation transporter
MQQRFSLLASAVGFEVLWAVTLKAARGFSVPWASSIVVLAYALSLVCLERACRSLDISLAYTVWTGSGASLVALIGICVFREPLGPARALGLLLVIGGVVLLLGFERG